MGTVKPQEFLDLAQSIAHAAGALAVSMRNAGISVQTTKSSQLDIVTQADTAVEALIRDRLNAARPHDGFLGEESGRRKSDTGITWIVDPIDGTVNYLYGSPLYSVSIAASVETEDGGLSPIAACVYAPELTAEYSAAVGHPAHLNNRPIHVNKDVPLDKALVSTAVQYDLSKRPRVLQDITALMPRIRDFRLIGGAAVEILGGPRQIGSACPWTS